jgi:L-ribulose-5-phosphate 4-epimerase
MDYAQYRQQVYETTLKLVEIDLIRLSSGNISVKCPDGNIAITPSGIAYDVLKPKDIIIMDADANLVEGEFKPSSEKQLHTEIYKMRPDVNAVVHTHSRYAIAFASVDMEIPVTNIEILAVGGPIPVADYAVPGTPEVGVAAAKYFVDRPRLKALLLKNHGMVAIGKSLNDAYQNAYKTETGAEIYHLSLQTGKEVKPLTEAQIADIFNRYQKPKEKQL